MFDVHTLAVMSAATLNEVRTFLPSVLNAIRNYTNRSFITDVCISDNFSISKGKIIVTKDIPAQIVPESQIELRYSVNNTKIYTVKKIDGNQIETYENLFDEEFEGFLIKLSFEDIDETTISSMISYKRSTVKRSALKSESLDGYSYTLNVESDKTSQGFPNSLMSSLNSLRKLPGSREVEYYERGFIK